MSLQVEHAISDIAAKTGVSRNALERLVYNESRGNPYIGMNSTNYSAGISQISRKVWESYSNLPYSDAAKAQYYKDNIAVAAEYLKANYKRFGNWRLALEAYNQGPTALSQVLAGKRQLSPITQRYIAGFKG